METLCAGPAAAAQPSNASSKSSAYPATEDDHKFQRWNSKVIAIWAGNVGRQVLEALVLSGGFGRFFMPTATKRVLSAYFMHPIILG
jgi:hypothetical protein